VRGSNHRSLRGLVSAALLLGVMVSGLASAGGATPDADAGANAAAREYRIKAAFLYNFAAFVDWPAKAVPDADGAFVIGVLGEDPFGAALDEIAATKTVGSKPIVVRRFATIDDYTACHILFVAASEREGWALILERLGDAPVLVVGDTEGFAEAGGMINLVIEDNTVRIEINQAATDRAGLKVSSKLLRLARRVGERAGARETPVRSGPAVRVNGPPAVRRGEVERMATTRTGDGARSERGGQGLTKGKVPLVPEAPFDGER